MKLLEIIEGATKGAAAGVALGLALPVFGPIGTLTAVGLRVFSTVGAVAGAAESFPPPSQSRSSDTSDFFGF